MVVVTVWKKINAENPSETRIHIRKAHAYGAAHRVGRHRPRQLAARCCRRSAPSVHSPQAERPHRVCPHALSDRWNLVGPTCAALVSSSTADINLPEVRTTVAGNTYQFTGGWGCSGVLTKFWSWRAARGHVNSTTLAMLFFCQRPDRYVVIWLFQILTVICAGKPKTYYLWSSAWGRGHGGTIPCCADKDRGLKYIRLGMKNDPMIKRIFYNGIFVNRNDRTVGSNNTIIHRHFDVFEDKFSINIGSCIQN